MQGDAGSKFCHPTCQLCDKTPCTAGALEEHQAIHLDNPSNCTGLMEEELKEGPLGEAQLTEMQPKEARFKEVQPEEGQHKALANHKTDSKEGGGLGLTTEEQSLLGAIGSEPAFLIDLLTRARHETLHAATNTGQTNLT